MHVMRTDLTRMCVPGHGEDWMIWMSMPDHSLATFARCQLTGTNCRSKCNTPHTDRAVAALQLVLHPHVRLAHRRRRGGRAAVQRHKRCAGCCAGWQGGWLLSLRCFAYCRPGRSHAAFQSRYNGSPPLTIRSFSHTRRNGSPPLTIHAALLLNGYRIARDLTFNARRPESTCGTPASLSLLTFSN